MISLINDETKVKSSSVLNRSHEFAAKNVLIEDESCWNSDADKDEQGQYLIFDFRRKVLLKEIELIFQGGFVGIDGRVVIGNDVSSLLKEDENENNSVDNDDNNLMKIEPEDSNESQIFNFDNNTQTGRMLKLAFKSTTDMFGRMTLYRVLIRGEEVEE